MLHPLTTFVIRLYQVTLSPDHGLVRAFFPDGCCRFSPSCSEYARVAVERHGPRGLWFALQRVLRCHPWSVGGADPVPSRPRPAV